MASVGFVLVVLLILAPVVAVQVSAGGQEDVLTSLSAAEVNRIFRSQFIEKLHKTEIRGDTISVTPRYKKDAPTISMRATSVDAGAEVSVWMSQWTRQMGVRNNAMWAWRKRRSFLAKLPKLDAAS